MTKRHNVARQAVPDNATADRMLLDGDQTRTGWKRRAVATTREAALAEIPLVGMIQCQMPVEPLRAVRAHIRTTAANQSQWMRQAVVEKYLREGGDPTVAEAGLTMRQIHKTYDVTGDQYGQDRRRKGRQRR